MRKLILNKFYYSSEFPFTRFYHSKKNLKRYSPDFHSRYSAKKREYIYNFTSKKNLSAEINITSSNMKLTLRRSTSLLSSFKANLVSDLFVRTEKIKTIFYALFMISDTRSLNQKMK